MSIIETMPPSAISDAEWEVMRIVWAHQGAFGRYIINGLQEKLSWNESTAKTLIRRLVEKGYLQAVKENGLNFYQPTVTEESCNLVAADKLFDRICTMKTGDFLGKLLDRYELSVGDIESLTAILQAKQGVEELHCQCTPCQCEHHRK